MFLFQHISILSSALPQERPPPFTMPPNKRKKVPKSTALPARGTLHKRTPIHSYDVAGQEDIYDLESVEGEGMIAHPITGVSENPKFQAHAPRTLHP